MPSTPVRSVMTEVIDFLATSPTPEEIIAYRLPDELVERAHYLLDLNSAGELTPEQREEMLEFARVDDMLTLLVAKLRLKLKQESA
jgi:hypothetical protein